MARDGVLQPELEAVRISRAALQPDAAVGRDDLQIGGEEVRELIPGLGVDQPEVARLERPDLLDRFEPFQPVDGASPALGFLVQWQERRIEAMART